MDPSAKYKLLEQVGNGSFGVVYKAVHKDTGEVVAIKEVHMATHATRQRQG
jgi:serine/threonine protein kinase